VAQQPDRARTKLKFIQSISSGTDQYSREALKAAGIRLASAQGVNARAVAEHAMALILAMTRQLHVARDNQHKQHWRGMISDLSKREDELGGKTLLVVGLGRIGSHLAGLARAFGMRVIGTKRDPGTGGTNADDVFSARAARRDPAARRLRRDHLRADAADRRADRRAGARPDEAVCVPDQRRARQDRRRAGTDCGAQRGPPRWRGSRLHGR
jgi:lactate dehydrogenase-like 2-hydroxyacid dehydrogenase